MRLSQSTCLTAPIHRPLPLSHHALLLSSSIPSFCPCFRPHSNPFVTFCLCFTSLFPTSCTWSPSIITELRSFPQSAALPSSSPGLFPAEHHFCQINWCLMSKFEWKWELSATVANLAMLAAPICYFTDTMKCEEKRDFHVSWSLQSLLSQQRVLSG